MTEKKQTFQPERFHRRLIGTFQNNFSVYADEYGCLCLESNEIDELDDYPVSMLTEELSAVKEDSGVYFYDDDSKEYYGIYCEECRVDDKGDVWINVR